MTPPGFVLPEMLPAVAEIFLLGTACIVLVVDVYLPERYRRLTYQLSQASLAGTALLVLATFPEARVTTFEGGFVADPMAAVLKVFILGVSGLGLFYSRVHLEARGSMRGEYFVLGLFAVLGMLVLVSAGSFLTLYLGLELLSLSLYALVALDRESRLASEAAMKYFVLGALASGMLLYGISMIYGSTGSVGFEAVAESIRAGGETAVGSGAGDGRGGEAAATTEAGSGVAVGGGVADGSEAASGSMAAAGSEGETAAMSAAGSGMRLTLVLGLVFVVVGVAFKLGAVPFHMWVPDVYEGAPTPVTLFIGTAPKIAAFGMLMRALVEGLGALQADWTQMLVVLAVLSMGAGNVIALAQTNIKRMLAYSTIAHVGFLFVGVVTGTAAGYAASMFYVLAYALMALGGFAMVIWLGSGGAGGGPPGRLPWVERAQPVVRVPDAGADAVDGGDAAVRGVLGEVVGAARGGGVGTGVAGGGGGAVLGGGVVLLPSGGAADVLRRAGGEGAGVVAGGDACGGERERAGDPGVGGVSGGAAEAVRGGGGALTHTRRERILHVRAVAHRKGPSAVSGGILNYRSEHEDSVDQK